MGAVALLGASYALAVKPAAPKTAVSAAGKVGANPGGIFESEVPRPKGANQLASFSGGCFWGVENAFRKTPGVVATAVGFTGGHTSSPTYEQVCSHTTGHAETVLVEFDPAKISYKKLLKSFWDHHDPTTVDRQGPDFGDQYRSVIWTFSPAQAAEALASMKVEQKSWEDPIVTKIQPAQRFWTAEDYHQQYDEKAGFESCPTPRKTKKL